MSGWRGNGRRLADIRVLNLAGVQGQLVLENDVERGAARKFWFGAAREQDGAESRQAAYPRANACTLRTARDGPYPGAGDGCGGYRADVFALAARAGHLAFGIHGLFAAAVCAARSGGQVNRVPIREDQRVELHAKLAAALDLSGALGFQNFSTQIRANRHNDAVVLGDWKGRTEIEG